MIAEIIPIKKMPRGLDYFDYEIPIELETSIKPGQLVGITFRKSNIFGLVFSLKKGNNEKLKKIDDIKFTEPIIESGIFSLWQNISDYYGISLGHVAVLFLPPLQKNKLKKIIVSGLPALPKKTMEKKKVISIYKTEKEHEQFIQNSISGTTLILVPEVNLIEDIKKILTEPQKELSISWHGDLSPKEQFAIWWQVRNGEKKIIIGTRSSVFLPFPELNTIIIDYEHDENHKHWDQTPRYHVKDISELLARTYNANLHLASFSPSVQSYFEVNKDLADSNFTPTEFSAYLKNDTEHIHLVDMLDERRAGRYGLFADETEKALLETKEDIFILVERLGLATSIGCNDCGRLEACKNCGTPLVYHEDNTMHCHYCHTITQKPETCPNCRSILSVLHGAGTETIEKYARKLLGTNLSHTIYRMDSEQKEVEINSEKPRLIIGTKMALKYVRWDKTKLIILTDPDKRLALPEFKSGEETWHLIQEILFRRQKNSDIYLQVKNPQGYFYKSLFEPDRFYRMDLNARQRLNYPPYSYIVRYLYAGADKNMVQKETNSLYQSLKSSLTNQEKNIIISNPIDTQPPYYRHQYWQEIICRLKVENWQKNLARLNKYIPANWKIDPHPNSLLGF